MEPNLTEAQKEALARLSAQADGSCAPERFMDALRQVVNVPKEELERRETEYQDRTAHRKKKVS